MLSRSKSIALGALAVAGCVPSQIDSPPSSSPNEALTQQTIRTDRPPYDEHLLRFEFTELARTFASFELGSPEAHGTSHVITYIQSFREGNPSGDYTFAISSGKPSYIELTLPTTREMTLHSPDGNGIFLLTLEAGDYRFPLLDQAVCAYVENWVNSSYPLGIGGKEDISEISR